MTRAGERFQLASGQLPVRSNLQAARTGGQLKQRLSNF